MLLLPHYGKRGKSLPLVWLFLTAFIFFVVGSTTITPEAAAQEAETLSRTVMVTSSPPGATVWEKEGTNLTCTNSVTPGKIELKFHGSNDLKRIRVRKFGYESKNLDVKPTDDKISAALGSPAPDSFLSGENAKPELKRLNAELRKEFEKTIFTDPGAFVCVPFELNFIHVVDDAGVLTLGLAIILDRGFGGPPFRLASHIKNRDERRRKLAEAMLEGGIADLLAHVNRIAAKFPNLKAITILSSYPTREAFLDTITRPPVFYSQTTITPFALFEQGAHGLMLRTGTIVHTQSGWIGGGEETIVKDRAAESAIKLVMPTDQIPDTFDKTAISDAVLAKGKIVLSE